MRSYNGLSVKVTLVDPSIGRNANRVMVWHVMRHLDLAASKKSVHCSVIVRGAGGYS